MNRIVKKIPYFIFLDSVFLLFLLMFVISSCSSKSVSYINKKQDRGILSISLSKIKKLIANKLDIKYGDIIVIYDLTENLNLNKLAKNNFVALNNKTRSLRNQTLYNKNLGDIINFPPKTQEYTALIINILQENNKKTTIKQLNIYSKRKLLLLKDIISRLDKQYQILDHAQRLSLSSLLIKKKKQDYLSNLHEIDKIVEYIPLMNPIKEAAVTSPYGKRLHPIYKKIILHKGIDLKAPKASPVYASASGKVVIAKRSKTHGNTIVIEHSNNIRTRYSHLLNINVKHGQNLNRGHFIGRQGDTGAATSEHLHFEILVKGVAINPSDFINFN